MKRLSRIALATAALAFSASAVAAEAAKPCLAPAEAQALLTYMLPGAFEALSAQCRATLPPNAVLTVSGRALADRYRPESEAAWPLTKIAFGKMSDPAMVKLLGDETVRKLVAAGITTEIPKAVKVQDCATVDRFVTALEPLPARNVAMLLGALMEVGAKVDAQGQKASPLNVCPAVAER